MEEKLLQYLREEYPHYEDEIRQLESWLFQESIVLESCDVSTSNRILNKIGQLIPISENTLFTIKQILKNTQSSYQQTQRTQQTQRRDYGTQSQMTQSWPNDRHNRH
ncbi:MAG: hypothetical protein IJQ99_05500 [Synergistaceae bacterium]|nr:hypothetical protein [Synergistaceae bacterium]